MMGKDLHNTIFVLTRYLKVMSVRISRRRVRQLLDNPMGDSMRGVSDALDEINIKHNTYLVPTALLDTIPTPFIIMLSEGSFHIIRNNNDMEKINFSKKEYHILVIESSQRILYKEPNYYINSWIGWIEENSLIIFTLLLGLFFIVFKSDSKISFFLNVTIYIGCILSCILMYKELFDKRYLSSYCKIGNFVDCNSVLDSKASRIGNVTLGEIAFVYYLTLLLCVLFGLPCSKSIWTYGALFAFLFSVWSIMFQFFFVHKICLFCFLLDCVIWVQTILIFGYGQYDFDVNSGVLLCILMIGLMCMNAVLAFRKLANFTEQARKMKKQKRILLSEPNHFCTLLNAQKRMLMANSDITMNSVQQGERHIQVILNPQCPYCASYFYELTKLKESLHLLLFTPANDVVAKNVALSVLTCYLHDGFQVAVDLLNTWFKEKNVSLLSKYPPDEKTFKLWQAQQKYLKEINLQYTPFATLDSKEIPMMYRIEDLKYLI